MSKVGVLDALALFCSKIPYSKLGRSLRGTEIRRRRPVRERDICNEIDLQMFVDLFCVEVNWFSVPFWLVGTGALRSATLS